MVDSIEKLNQEPIFYFFNEISKIPRCPGEEKEISDYLMSFAKERNLEAIQDDFLNVIIKKDAKKGYENVPPVIIQGHMDMVCEKNKGTDHDFLKDPLQLQKKGDMLYATDTTLGADNGVAVAFALALLDDKSISHPALEVVITTEEETSMKGALGLNPKYFNGKTLINLDSEEEDVLLVSGAGGMQTVQNIKIDFEETPDNYLTYEVAVKGLQGGHSGFEIDKERGNANKLLGRILKDLSEKTEFHIQKIRGGMASNAIPREAECCVALHENQVAILEDFEKKWANLLREEFGITDPGIIVNIQPLKSKIVKSFSKKAKEQLIASLLLSPNGIQSMSMDIEGLVESSVNLGKISMDESTVSLESDVRSSVKSRKYAISTQTETLAQIIGCDIEMKSDYAEWPFNPKSRIQKLFEDVYKKRKGKEIRKTSVHAGIECGILIDKMPGLDAIAIGPNIYDVHTPNEHVSISSMLRTWEYFLSVLKEIQ